MKPRIEHTIDPREHDNVFALLVGDSRFIHSHNIDQLIKLAEKAMDQDYSIWKKAVCKYDEAHADRKRHASRIVPLYEEKLEAQFQMEKSIYRERALREFANNPKGSSAIVRAHFKKALAG